MKHRFLWLAILILLLFFQMVFIPHMSLQNVSVDLLSMVVMAYALLQGKQEGLVMGIIAGFLSDSLFGSPFGLQILIKGTLGLWVGSLSDLFFQDQLIVPAVISVLGFTYTEVISHVANALFFKAKIWPSSRYRQIFFLSFLFEPFIFILIYLIIKKIFSVEKQLGWLKDRVS